jgi:hypothetical protein
MNKKIKENGNGTNNETTKPATVINTPSRKPFFAIFLSSSLSMKNIISPPMKAKKMGRRNQALLGRWLLLALVMLLPLPSRRDHNHCHLPPSNKQQHFISRESDLCIRYFTLFIIRSSHRNVIY